MQKNTKWWIFIGAGLMILLVNIDTTIVNLALAQIAHNLKTDLAQTQWVINAYLLTTAIFFIVGGKLSDNYGPKPIFLIGTVFFGASSLLAGISPNIKMLIFARLLQGVGFAFTLSLALLMISRIFPPQQRGFALGLAITLTGVGQALGPTLGGIILNELDWHWIFLINIPFTIFSFVIIYFFAEATAGHRKMIDYQGVLLFGISVIILLLTFNLLTGEHINVPLFFVGLLVTIILFLIFYWKEIKTHNPLVDFRLFRRHDYLLSILIRFLFMYIYGTFLFFVPLYLQNILGFSPLMAGFILLIYSAIFAICAPIAGYWADRVGYRIPIIVSGVTSTLGFLLLTLITPQSSLHLVVIALLLLGFSGGLIIPSTVNSTLSSLPKESSGEGLGMFFTIAFISTSLGVAVSGVQLNFVSWHKFLSLLSLPLPHLEILRHATNGTQSISTFTSFFTPTQMTTLTPLVHQSFIHGFNSVMALNTLLAATMFALSIFLEKKKS